MAKKKPSFLIPATMLEQGLSLLKPYAGTRTSIPALKCVHIRATHNSSIEMTVTDMESTVKYEGQGTVFYAGNLLVPIQELTDAVKAVKGKHNVIELHENGESKVQVKGATSVIVDTLPPEDFPEQPFTKPERTETIYLQGESVLSALEWVAPAMSMDETRPILATLNLKVSDEGCEFQATDSYRLHTKLVQMKGKTDLAHGDYPIPSYFVKALTKQLKKAKPEYVAFAFGYANNDKRPHTCGVRAKDVNCIWRTRVVEGDYPKVAQLVPAYAPGYMYCVMDHDDYAPVLDAIAKVAKKAHNAPAVLTILRTGDGATDYEARLAYRTDTVDVDEDVKNIGVYIPEPEKAEVEFPFAIGFNPQFLHESFTCQERVGFQLISPLRPMVATPDLDMEAMALLMPIRLND